MKIQFRIRGLNANAGVRTWLVQQLEHLHTLIPVSAADVRLERQQDASPSFQAYVHLAVSGPDIYATASDHTIQTGWKNVITHLIRQIEERQTKHKARHKRTRQVRGRSVAGPALASSQGGRTIHWSRCIPEAALGQARQTP